MNSPAEQMRAKEDNECPECQKHWCDCECHLGWEDPDDEN